VRGWPDFEVVCRRGNVTDELRLLLDRLDDQWHVQNHPLARRARPGVSPERTAQALEDLGLFASPEVLTWYQWHDGTVDGNRADMRFGGAQFWLNSLDDQVKWCREIRRIMQDVAAQSRVDVGELWRHEWWPLARNDANVSLVLTLAVGRDSTPQTFSHGSVVSRMPVSVRTLPELSPARFGGTPRARFGNATRQPCLRPTRSKDSRRSGRPLRENGT
jgi:cell wall assembly regulator SMI1